jgi:predicted TIM-barrel fold metal-dependent hydrolase
MSDRVAVVSGDGHIGAPLEAYRDYLDPKFHAALDDLKRQDAAERAGLKKAVKDRMTPEQLKVVDVDDAIATDGEFGGWDFQRRLVELDGQGIAVDVLHAGPHLMTLPFFSIMNTPFPVELRLAGMRAYHRWAADSMAIAPERFVGIADPGPCLDFAQTERDLRWCKEHGFGGVSLVQQTWDQNLPAIQDRYYEPFWSICEDLDLVLSVHAGWGMPQGAFQEFCKGFTANVLGTDTEDEFFRQGLLADDKMDLMMEAMASDPDSPLALDMGPRRAVWQLMAGGVFDRHPQLRLALTEVRADWVPGTLAALDGAFARGEFPLRQRPRDYWTQHCFVSPSSIHRCEVEMRHQIGMGQIMFGADYPHPEGTWPNTKTWIREALAGVPAEEVRAILAGNAIRCYGLDPARVEAIAARVGPTSEEVFATQAVDPALIEHFTLRAGYLRGPEEVDTDTVTNLLQEDLRTLVS